MSDENPRKELLVELTLVEPGNVIGPEPAIGWGTDACEVGVRGKVAKIHVSRDGISEFSLVIEEDGSLVLTNYGSRYEVSLAQNAVLRPTRPWVETYGGES